jgi:hypothetical protein
MDDVYRALRVLRQKLDAWKNQSFWAKIQTKKGNEFY